MQVQGLPLPPSVGASISEGLARRVLSTDNSMTLVFVATPLLARCPFGYVPRPFVSRAHVAVCVGCVGRSWRRRRRRAQELPKGYLAGVLKPRPAHRVGHPATNRHHLHRVSDNEQNVRGVSLCSNKG